MGYGGKVMFVSAAYALLQVMSNWSVAGKEEGPDGNKSLARFPRPLGHTKLRGQSRWG